MKDTHWLRRAALTIPLLLVPLSAIAESKLPAPVRSVLNIREIPYESLSIHVSDLESGATVLEWNDEVARNPASTMKLLTTLVALDVLGPSYRWKTDVYALAILLWEALSSRRPWADTLPLEIVHRVSSPSLTLTLMPGGALPAHLRAQ